MHPMAKPSTMTPRSGYLTYVKLISMLANIQVELFDGPE